MSSGMGAVPVQKSNTLAFVVSLYVVSAGCASVDIHRVHPNKGPLNILEKRECWLAYPATAQFFWVPPIISETGKATNFKF